MNRARTRVALVGYGAVATKHIEVFRDLGAEICASCNRSEAKRELARTAGGIERTYPDHMEMVGREKPDAVLITANVLSIFELARDLIPLGIPILVEKPAGTSLKQAEEMAALAARHSTPVMVGLNRRFYSVYHRALGAMGGREAVTAVGVEWSEDPRKMIELGHPLAILPLLNFANSLHGIDLLEMFAGPSDGTAWGRELGDAGSYRWQMSYQGVSGSDANARFDSSWDVPGRWRLVVDSRDARLVSAPLETGLLLVRGKPQAEVEVSPEDKKFKPGFHGQAAAFLNTVRAGAPVEWPACSLAEAVGSMRIAGLLTDTCLAGGAAN